MDDDGGAAAGQGRIGRRDVECKDVACGHDRQGMRSCKTHSVLSWSLQGVAAAILGQTLFFKFTAAPESVYIFSKLGAEPWGRVATGLAELVAVILLLTPRWAAVGALLSLGLMTGAVGSHVTRLGIVVQNDGGLLFGLAGVVMACAIGILVLRRGELPGVGPRLRAGSCG